MLEEKEATPVDEDNVGDEEIEQLKSIKQNFEIGLGKLREKTIVVGCLAAATLETVHELMGDTNVPFGAIATGILLVVYNRMKRTSVLKEQIKLSIDSVIERMKYIMEPLKEIKESLFKSNSIKVGSNYFEEGTRVYDKTNKGKEYIIWKLQDKIIYIVPEIFKDSGVRPPVLNGNKDTRLTRSNDNNWVKETNDGLQYEILTPFYLEKNSQHYLMYTQTSGIEPQNLICDKKKFLGNLDMIELELLTYMIQLIEICVRWEKREKTRTTTIARLRQRRLLCLR